MKTNTVTITVFPTYKEISTPVYRGGIPSQEIFENHFVSESYQQDREKLESTVTKLIDAGLNGIKGRSAAKSKIEKTNYLLEHGFGYYYNSDGKISCKGSEQPADCDFYGNVPEVSPEVSHEVSPVVSPVVSPAVSPEVSPVVSHADLPAVSHVDRPAVSHVDHPAVSHADRPAVSHEVSPAAGDAGIGLAAW